MAKYGEGGFQVFVQLLIVPLDARFFYEILVAAAKILAFGVGFHETVGGAQREDHRHRRPVGMIIGDFFHIDVETALFGDHFAERNRLEIGVVLGELEDERLFQIGVGIEFFVCGVVGFVDFDIVAFFELEYDLTIEDEYRDKNENRVYCVHCS